MSYLDKKKREKSMVSGKIPSEVTEKLGIFSDKEKAGKSGTTRPALQEVFKRVLQGKIKRTLDTTSKPCGEK